MLTLLGGLCPGFGRRLGPLKLPHFIAKYKGKLLLSLIDHKGRKVTLMIVLRNKLSEFLSLNGAPRILMGFEKHVPNQFPNKLIFFLKKKSNKNMPYFPKSVHF